MAIARRSVAAEGRTAGEVLGVEVFVTKDDHGTPLLRYRITLKLEGGQGGSAHVIIDDPTGEVSLCSLTPPDMSRPGGPGPRRQGPFDADPSWVQLEGGPAQVAFTSNRRLLGTPEWKDTRRTGFLATLDGTVHGLSDAQGGDYSRAQGARDVVVLQAAIEAWVMSLRTGETSRLCDEKRPGLESSVSRSGRVVCFTSVREDEGGEDIFCADLTEGRPGPHRRVCRKPGLDRRAVVGADERYVYWVHAYDVPGAGHGTSRAKILRAPLPPADGAIPDPEIVSPELPSVQGLSPFPDARRLLLWHDDGLAVLDVEQKTVEPLRWPELRDPSLPGCRPLEVNAPAVSPDGTLVAFHATRWDGRPETPSGCFIYVCDLEGQGLRRLTPLENEPVAPYVFPATGRTAFTVEP